MCCRVVDNGMLLVLVVFKVSNKYKPYMNYLNFMFPPFLIWTTITLSFSISIFTCAPGIDSKSLNEIMFESNSGF